MVLSPYGDLVEDRAFLLAGDPRNLAAADSLADEVACMANTPGGGALVVRVEDRTGSLLGAPWMPSGSGTGCGSGSRLRRPSRSAA